MKKRNQSIFTRLVQSNSIFKSGIFVDVPYYLPRGALFIERFKALKESSVSKKITNNITVISPCFCIPFSYRYFVSKIVSSFIAKRIRSMVGKDRYCLWINSPQSSFYHIARGLIPYADRVVVDLSDDFTTFDSNDSDAVRSRLEEYIANADVLLAINENVASKFYHHQTFIFPNSTDYDNFQKNNPSYSFYPVLPKPINSQYIGFIGGFNRGRIDEQLLYRLLESLPTALFVFVGYTNDKSMQQSFLESSQNVIFIDSVPYEDLPYFIRSFDVAIVPHLINEHTRGNDLLKVLDYLACGVPVVSTRCSNVDKYSDALYIADDHNSFICYIQNILNSSIVHNPNNGIKYAKISSWDATVPLLEQYLSKFM